MSAVDVSWVVSVGAVELALGAASGWIVAATIDKPEWVKRAGVKSFPRIRQAHLDYIIMGVILIAVGLAAPDLPKLWSWLLVIGAWVNPTLFIPLAFRPEASGERWYKAISVASFACMTAGTAAAAVWLL